MCMTSDALGKNNIDTVTLKCREKKNHACPAVQSTMGLNRDDTRKKNLCDELADFQNISQLLIVQLSFLN